MDPDCVIIEDQGRQSPNSRKLRQKNDFGDSADDRRSRKDPDVRVQVHEGVHPLFEEPVVSKAKPSSTIVFS